MYPKAIRINGEPLVLTEEVACNDVNSEMQPEEVAAFADGFEMGYNLQSDIIFYNGKERQICFAGIHNSPMLHQDIPDVPLGEMRIGDDPEIKVLYVDQENIPRTLNKLKIEGGDDALRTEVKQLLRNHGISEGEDITYEQFIVAQKVLKLYSIEKGHAISATLGKGKHIEGLFSKIGLAQKQYGLALSVRIAKISRENVDFVIKDDGILSDQGKRMFEDIFKDASPAMLAAVFFKEVPLEKVFLDNKLVRSAFEPTFQSDEAENRDKLALSIFADLNSRVTLKRTMIDKDGKVRFEIEISGEFGQAEVTGDTELIETMGVVPDSEIKRRTEELSDIKKDLIGVNNSFKLYFRLEKMRISKSIGWANEKPSQSRLFSYEVEEIEGPNGPVSVVKFRSSPFPKKISIEGDFPSEDRAKIEEMVMPTVRHGRVNLNMLDGVERPEEKLIYRVMGKDTPDVSTNGGVLRKLRGFYEDRGYKIKNLGYVVDDRGILHLVVDIRRWDSIYSVVLSAEKESKESVAENRSMLEGVMKEYEGRFITEENIAAIKSKLARGFSRSSIDPYFATEGGEGKTVAVFVAAENEISPRLPVSGGLSSMGMVLSGEYAIDDNGHGTSWSVGGNVDRSIGLAHWDKKDVRFMSLKANFSTSVSSSERISVSTYYQASNYEGAHEALGGIDTTYTHYYLNDAVTTDLGNAIEFIISKEDDKGFTGAPVRLKPHGGVCYSKDNLEICVRTSVSTIAANYGSSVASFQYRIPMNDSKEDPLRVDLKAIAGVQNGTVPTLEQFNQMAMGLPFVASIVDSQLQFGTYMAGTSAELTQVLSSWLAIKPVAASVSTIGKYSSASIGPCISLWFFDGCLGFRKNIRNTKDGIDFSLSFSNTFKTMEPLRRLLEGVHNLR